mmetsp:Transcript_27902/g.47255  ORF Transcript_27902/g.47255 Transcript_27902/m.47255 type:complete len:105 (-) Transcript_27902:8-322(-)
MRMFAASGDGNTFPSVSRITPVFKGGTGRPLILVAFCQSDILKGIQPAKEGLSASLDPVVSLVGRRRVAFVSYPKKMLSVIVFKAFVPPLPSVVYFGLGLYVRR